MKNNQSYLEFLKSNGISLSDINPGSSDISKSLEAIHILADKEWAILGADVLVKDNKGKLGYVHHILGEEYIYLSWYCDPLENETRDAYLKRSHTKALTAIDEISKVNQKWDKECYMVLVV